MTQNGPAQGPAPDPRRGVSAGQIFWRGLRMRCPRCGGGAIFRRWWTYTEYNQCPKCGLAYDPRGESLAFMYLSTAFITGLFFIVLVTVPPRNLETYRLRLAGAALLLYVATLPVRKALAIALNHLNSR